MKIPICFSYFSEKTILTFSKTNSLNLFLSITSLLTLADHF